MLPMLLAGCVTANSSRVTACPPLVTYDAAFQKKAADELDTLPPGSAVGQMIADYGKTRSACRALGY